MYMTHGNTMNNETQYAYPCWTEAELKIIGEHRNYHYEMMYYVENLEKDGPNILPPTKPKTSLETLIKNTYSSKELKPKFDLHSYLCQNLVNPSEQCPTVSTVSQYIEQKQEFTCLENILTFLQNGYKIIKIQNANTLKT